MALAQPENKDFTRKTALVIPQLHPHQNINPKPSKMKFWTKTQYLRVT